MTGGTGASADSDNAITAEVDGVHRSAASLQAEPELQLLQRMLAERTDEVRELRGRLHSLQLAEAEAGLGIWAADLRTATGWWSPHTYTLHGLEADEQAPSGERYLELIHAEDRELLASTMEELARGCPPEKREFRTNPERGPVRILRTGYHVEQDEAGSPIRLVGTVLDVTAYRQVEAALQASEARFRLLFETMAQGVIYQGVDGSIIDANPAAQRILGLSVEQMSGRTSFDPRWRAVREDGSVFPGELHPSMVALRTGVAVHGVVMGVHNPVTNTQRWLRINATPLFLTGAATPSQVYTTFDDITDQKQTEQALRDAEYKYRMLVEQSPVVVYVAENSERWLYISPQIERVLGYPADEYLADPQLWRDRIHPDDRAELRRKIEGMAGRSGRLNVEYRITARAGRLVWVRDESEVVTDPLTGHAVIHGVMYDITERKQAELLLRQSEARFATIFEHSPIALGISRLRDGIIIDANTALLNLYGYSREQLIGRSTLELGIGARRSDRQQVLEQLRTQQRIAGFESVARLASGEERPVLLSGELVQINDEQHMLMQIMDISALKTAQQELNRTLEERVRQRTAEVHDLYDNAPTGYYSLDADGIVIRVNQTLLDWLGYTREELLGRLFSDLIVPEHRAVFAMGFPGFKAHGWLRGIDGKLLRKDGSVFHVLLSATAVYDANGAYLSSRATVFDNTERKQAEDALRESEEQNRLLFEESPGAVALFDRLGKIVRANRAFTQLVGYPSEHLLGQTFEALDLVSPKQMAALGAEMQTSLMDEPGFAEATLQLTRADGAALVVELRAFALTIGQQHHYLAAIRDVTAAKRTEETLRRANAELARAARAKDEFLANMSHELRTPLNAILGYGESLQEGIYGSLSPQQLRAIRSIESGGRHLLNLINDILDLAKIEAGRLTVEAEWVTLLDVCEASLLFVRELALKKQLRLDFHLDDRRAVMKVDPLRLKQMLVNLLSNAVKFTPPGGTVGLEVTVEEPAGAALFTVHDTGVGIPPEDLSWLFRPFSQLDSTLSREHEGAGLGLALVRRLAELHGGSVTVESEVGKGSRFTLILPRRQTAGEIPPQEPVTGAPVEAEPPRAVERVRGRILLADDNEGNVDATVAYLRARGYEVTVAKNGCEALAQADAVHPQLILMDIQMPEMDGLEATSRLRALPAYRTTPIIALSALAQPGDEERCLAAGATTYVAKPVRLRALVELIQQLISPKTQRDIV